MRKWVRGILESLVSLSLVGERERGEQENASDHKAVFSLMLPDVLQLCHFQELDKGIITTAS